jgi:hypothetical protein
MEDRDPIQVSWPHLGHIDKWHVDLQKPVEDHHHSLTLFPSPKDDGGNTLSAQLPPPYGRIPEPK